jgi:protein-tyrosine phosphatase
MAVVLNWQHAEDRGTIVDRAVRALEEGKLVVFPTETVYGLAASARVPQAVEQLHAGKGRPESKPLALAIRGFEELTDWVRDPGTLGKRLARKAWPGPLTLVFPLDPAPGPVAELPETVLQRVAPAGTIGLRVPDHDAILDVLDRMQGPLVLTSANAGGEPPALTAEKALIAVGEQAELIIDDGPCRYGQPSTVVKVDQKEWQILREGVLSREDIARYAACTIIFICTGNTCRSPLAEGICKKLLAETLTCRLDELPARGFLVLSAGLAAMIGGCAAAEAIEVARDMGVDLAGHGCRLLMPGLLRAADYVFGMTGIHLQTISLYFPDFGVKPRLLSPQGNDLPDPVGQDKPVYEECARLIEGYLQEVLPELLNECRVSANV